MDFGRAVWTLQSSQNGVQTIKIQKPSSAKWLLLVKIHEAFNEGAEEDLSVDALPVYINTVSDREGFLHMMVK